MRDQHWDCGAKRLCLSPGKGYLYLHIEVIGVMDIHEFSSSLLVGNGATTLRHAFEGRRGYISGNMQGGWGGVSYDKVFIDLTGDVVTFTTQMGQRLESITLTSDQRAEVVAYLDAWMREQT